MNSYKYNIKLTKQFDKDLKLAKKRNLDLKLLWVVVRKLACGEKLDPKYKDHVLSGSSQNCRECHIRPDWLLIYKIDKGNLILYLLATGLHSDLFN